jgi:hypothetical protein
MLMANTNHYRLNTPDRAFEIGRSLVGERIALADKYKVEDRTFHNGNLGDGTVWNTIASIAIGTDYDVLLGVEGREELRGKIDAAVEFAVKAVLQHRAIEESRQPLAKSGQEVPTELQGVELG